MDKKEKAKIIGKILNKKFPHPKLPLNHTTTFTLLIAVLLSANTTDKSVNTVTPKLFAMANSAKKMEKLSTSKIQSTIRTCGLAPTKAKAIKQLSKVLVEKYNGSVPKTFEELEKLPRVGHKTASVVMGYAFKKPAFPVDTHVHRLAKRWGLSSGKNVKQTEEDLKEVFPQKKTWMKRALQIIYFGRIFCKARGHKKENCPICSVI